ncbi:squalene/phytoene synthase family protein [Nocardia terpenica]|uniref:Phytoene/squalene synthase family protein n=1 Tax=Nocardia terpenica TaxID=455432 RepID=A0A6G9ZEG5_9NOCA|nr:squalene/phytoene synthase family protein [Nocardia terpenica]QIS23496.1 phytoene/squalene synthase family protein [Nocardia terpenica]
MSLLAEGHAMVRTYSTTWYEPITSMPPGLDEATTCAYLCMRAIDEIEDHPDLNGEAKASLLEVASRLLQTRFTQADFVAAYRDHTAVLPEVSLRIAEWTTLAPPEIAPRVLETFAAMAERMADWARDGFTIATERDLDRYTYAVSGTLVLMLSDLWAWHDGTRTHRAHGIGYGRALQSANILIDRTTDTTRGVDFWPNGWHTDDMLRYVHTELALAERYVLALPDGPARRFCEPALRRYQRRLSGDIGDFAVIDQDASGRSCHDTDDR